MLFLGDMDCGESIPTKSWCEKTLQSAQKLADAHNLNNDMPEIDDNGSR